jgi:hypothetical protein
MNKLVRVIPLLLLGTCLFLLVSGSSFLLKPIIAGADFPGGTLISWVGLVSLPLSMLLNIRDFRLASIRKYKAYRIVLIGLTLLALSWGIISYLLAGNWMFSFGDSEKFQGSPEAFSFFTYYTAILVSLSLLILLIHGIHQLILRTK